MLSKVIVVHFDVIYQSDIDHISYEIYLVVLEKNKVGWCYTKVCHCKQRKKSFLKPTFYVSKILHN